MKGSISCTALCIVFGGAMGILMFLLTGQNWWFGLVGVGIVLGAAIDGMKRE